MLKVGTKVTIKCDVVGEVLDDLTRSQYSVLVRFDNQIARLPIDGTLLGLKCVKLIEVQNEE